jgi:hypothetical protein
MATIKKKKNRSERRVAKYTSSGNAIAITLQTLDMHTRVRMFGKYTSRGKSMTITQLLLQQNAHFYY